MGNFLIYIHLNCLHKIKFTHHEGKMLKTFSIEQITDVLYLVLTKLGGRITD